MLSEPTAAHGPGYPDYGLQDSQRSGLVPLSEALPVCGPRTLLLELWQQGPQALTSLARRASGYTPLLRCLGWSCRPVSRAGAGLAVVGLACEGVAVETWQAALT